jgi:transposase-like protein
MTQQRRFTKEFEEEAVRLVQTSGRTQREIAGDLGIGLSTLVRWSAGAGIGALLSQRQRRAIVSITQSRSSSGAQSLTSDDAAIRSIRAALASMSIPLLGMIRPLSY